MLPVKQTILHDPENGKFGNCLSAVIASLLHLPINDVPVFSDPENWILDLNNWLDQYNLMYILISNPEELKATYKPFNFYHEISGGSPIFADVGHSCVGKDMEVLFDPHPDVNDAQGLPETNSVGIFALKQPWLLTDENPVRKFRKLFSDVDELEKFVHRVRSSWRDFDIFHKMMDSGNFPQPEWRRVGNSICKVCGNEYNDHPSHVPYYFLTILCCGSVVKL